MGILQAGVYDHSHITGLAKATNANTRFATAGPRIEAEWLDEAYRRARGLEHHAAPGVRREGRPGARLPVAQGAAPYLGAVEDGARGQRRRIHHPGLRHQLPEQPQAAGTE